jgi:large exoprotein involved in heme utilization and adhesion
MTGGRLLATGAAGAAGTVRLKVERLVLTDGAQINVNTIGQGHAGRVAITATEAITISGENAVGETSGLLSNSFGPEAAGVLTVVTPTLTLNGGLMQTVKWQPV